MFQKTFNRLALLCAIRLGSYTQQLPNQHLITKNFSFPSVLTCASFSHKLYISHKNHSVLPTVGAVVILSLKKRVPVIYLFAGFQERGKSTRHRQGKLKVSN